MSHPVSNSDAVRIRRREAADVARELTRQSAAGYVCTDRNRRLGATVMTFAPAPNEPMRLFAAIQWTDFWQPAGWDFAFSDKSACLISYPLPPGTVTEEGSYEEEDFAEEQAFLAEHAARGLRLAAVRESTYYFIPAEPATVTYIIAESPSLFGNLTILTPPAAAPNERGYYFLCVSEGGRCYYADTKSSLPPRNGTFLDYADFCDGVTAHYRGAERTVRSIFGFAVILALLIAGGNMLLHPTENILSGLVLVLAVFFGAMLVGLCYALRRECRGILARIPSEVDYPTEPPALSKKSRPAVPPAVNETGRRKALKRSRLFQALLALASIACFCFTVYCFLTDSFSEDFHLLEGIVLLIAAPLSIYSAVSRVISLTRKLRKMGAEQQETKSH